MKKYTEEMGHICRDFQYFCEFLSTSRIKLSKRTGYVGKQACFEMNQRIYHREPFDKATRAMDRYPVLIFFYCAAFRYDILKRTADDRVVRGEHYETFFSTSETDQYLFLFMNLVYDNIPGEHEQFDFAEGIREFLQQNSKEKEKNRTVRMKPSDLFWHSDFFAGGISLLEEFSLVSTVEQCDWEKERREGYRRREYKIQISGLAVYLSKMYETIQLDDEGWSFTEGMYHYLKAYCGYCNGEHADDGILEMFEETKQTVSCDQTYEFEVCMRHHDCSRTIRLPANATLKLVHEMIQEAFEFDDDHLYMFSQGAGIFRTVYCPAEAVTDGTELSVEDTRIADMELTKNTLLEYLFDFGDRWWFDIKVKAIYEGKAESAEITDFYGKAPAQYPDWEEEGYYCTISNEQKVWDILQEIDDESVEINYTAVFEMRDERYMRTDDPEKRRERIADMVLSNPEDMMSFFQDEVRHLLFCCMQEDEWIDRDSRCELMKLYSLGFCKVEQDEIIIPEEIRSVYEAAGEKIKGNILADQIAELAEKYLNLCGVMEMSTLYELIRPMIRRKYEYRDFRWWVFCHLVFWGRYEMWEKDRTEYMSLYDENLTWKIIEEREKYENESYPVFTKKALLEQEEYADAKKEWKDYINFSLSIDYRSANKLIYRIPCLIASGVIAQDELIAYYGDEVRKAGGRKTKKAEKIIEKMYQELRVAARRGNWPNERKPAAEGKAAQERKKETALKEKMAPKRENGTVSRKKTEPGGKNRIDSTKKKEAAEGKMDEGYVQLSLFDDM